ncbi:hypothetical protein AURDEDRAFT_175313 [Auricularia subglabra TFB-10046 SS5]|nr:hypothetical protein AURDEDRAFT_175313 [Auricularia subglabra TFB-10046 SS5]
MILQLPAELVDMVIDVLYDDRRALRTCALVAKSWTPRTRVWLFRAIHVGRRINIYYDSGSHPDLFPSSRFTWMTLDRFAQYLRRAKSLVAHLRDMRLVLDRDEFGSTNRCDYLLSKIPTPFPIRRLYVNIQDTNHVFHVLRSLRSCIPSLDTFSLMSCATGTSDITRILSIYPELRTVYPASVYFDDELRNPTLSPPMLCTQTSSNHAQPRLVLITSSAILPWASRHLRSCDRLFLQHADIAEETPTDVMEAVSDPKTKSLVSGVELSLAKKHTDITFRRVESFPRLKVLQLVYDELFGIYLERPQSVADLLVNLPDACARLQALAIVFLITFHRMHILHDYDWASLDELLAQPGWEHLHVLVSVGRWTKFGEGNATGPLLWNP